MSLIIRFLLIVVLGHIGLGSIHVQVRDRYDDDDDSWLDLESEMVSYEGIYDDTREVMIHEDPLMELFTTEPPRNSTIESSSMDNLTEVTDIAELSEETTTINSVLLEMDGIIDSDMDYDFATECLMSGNDSYAPHKHNCRLFYICHNGTARIGVCPPGMWFDSTNKATILCNYPQVICGIDDSVCKCQELDSTELNFSSEEHCPFDNELYFSPNEFDCEKYSICMNNKVHEMHCGNGLHYNVDQSVCDLPKHANCQVRDPDCPKDGITFLSHPGCCNSFYFCLDGFKSVQHCPFYHYWNETEERCILQPAGFICDKEQ